MTKANDNEDLDLEVLVKTAKSLSRHELAQFMLELPAATREVLLTRIAEDQTELASRTARHPNSKDLPPTIIVEPASAYPTHPTQEGKLDNVSLEEPAAPQVNLNLINLHARGAVGEIFVAFDDHLSREVALKRIRPDLPHSERRFQRFIREAEITAKLQHPGIVPIYDLIASGDQAHYTMPLVSGSTLADLIVIAHEELSDRPNREEWTSKFRPLLMRFIAVCDAIGYAHSKEVLHRDIKPENIMIGSQGQTLVLDWGCAKDLHAASQIDESLPQIEDKELASLFGVAPQNRMTIAGSVMGTLAFMSPEQASGESKRVGTHSDIFGLGATLFNLLTNEVIYDNTGSTVNVDSAIEEVQRGKFRRIEEVDSRVPAPLVAICHRAMEFAPEDRYATVGDLGRDIDAFLAGDRVSAYPEPFRDGAMRFVKRHRTVFATLLGTLLVGFVSLAFLTLMISQQRNQLSDKNSELANLNDQLSTSVDTEKKLTLAATARENQSKRKLYETEMLLASEAASEPGGIGRMRQLVQRWGDTELESIRGWEWQHLDALGNSELWKIDLNATANRVIFTRDAADARVFDSGRSVMFRIDTETKTVVEQLKLPKNVTAVDFNRDQSLLAIGFRNGDVRILRLTGDNLKSVDFKKLKSPVTNLRWNIGGDHLATCDASGELAVWQWYEREVKFSGKGVLNLSNKQLLEWSYDGMKLYWTTGKEVRELSLADKKETPIVRDSWIVNPCWSHEGKLLAYIGAENSIIVRDLETAKTTRFKGHQLFVESLRWHPNKHYLLSSSADGSVRIWDADTEKEIRQLLGHDGHVYAAEWNPAGTKVVSGGLPEDQLRGWDVSNLGSEAQDRELQDHPAFAWHPDGTQLVVAEGTNILIQNDGGESRLIGSDDTNLVKIFGLDLDPTGNQIACVSLAGRIWTIDATDGTILKIYDEGSENNQYPEITCKGVAWSPDGKFLAGVGGNGVIKVWDQVTGKEIAEKVSQGIKKPLVVAWSPIVDKRSSLAIAGTDDSIFVFDPLKKQVVKKITQYGWKTGLTWSPDGTKLAVSNRRGINIWNIDTDQLIGQCEGPSAMIRDLSWSSSQNRIAALAENGMLCVWNAETHAFCAKFKLHQRSPYSLRWSPDGTQLVSTARHGRIVFQSVAKPQEAVNAEIP